MLGYGKCSWTDLFRSESTIVDGKGERSAVKYSGTEEYLSTTMYIVGSKNGKACSVTMSLLPIFLCFAPNIWLNVLKHEWTENSRKRVHDAWKQNVEAKANIRNAKSHLAEHEQRVNRILINLSHIRWSLSGCLVAVGWLLSACSVIDQMTAYVVIWNRIHRNELLTGNAWKQRENKVRCTRTTAYNFVLGVKSRSHAFFTD